MRALVSATISIAALRHNLAAIRRQASRSKIMAVVKANAYGHGLAAVAQALGEADAFAVARIEEGLVLRSAGITRPIVLLEGVFDCEQLAGAAQGRFDLVVHSAEQLDLLRAAPARARFTVWLKLDTGMNRLGFRPNRFEAARAALARLACVEQPVRLCTHMANADTPEHPGTLQQLALFERACAGLLGERSVANSAALFAFPQSQCDWVRPGLALFGVSPFGDKLGADLGLLPVMTLRTRIIALKTLEAGESVGYGSLWTARRRTRLAIAAVGYGDGYPRNVISNTQVLVAGRRAPLAGRVSMDMIGIDTTDVPDIQCGAEVVLWGEGLPVERVASCAGTVPYELLCGISQRVAVDLI
ncbi:MAG: alanine racemase [Proteobacteria bacterium]|nr:alanine racemase [Pseudomonadota bacterium]